MDKKLCPSASMKEAELLLGIVEQDGSIGFFGKPLPLSARFKSLANQGRTPEKRFRFAAPCAEKGCANWKESSCNIAKKVGEVKLYKKDDYAACGIRSCCRWFAQDGIRICNNCRFLITDTRYE